MPEKPETDRCLVCKDEKSIDDLVLGETIRATLAAFIQKKYPEWIPEKYICRTDYNELRHDYLRSVLEAEKGELSKLDTEVVESLTKHEIVTKNINTEFEQELTLGAKMSDRLSSFCGSWKFISLMSLFILIWIVTNTSAFTTKPFDPFPFILLTLVLSCLAVIQAPIIMMSQNRKEERDRLRGEHDYKIDLKAELEIRHLHEKIDYLISNQWQRLLEIQQMQIELLEEMKQKKR